MNTHVWWITVRALKAQCLIQTVALCDFCFETPCTHSFTYLKSELHHNTTARRSICVWYLS